MRTRFMMRAAATAALLIGTLALPMTAPAGADRGATDDEPVTSDGNTVSGNVGTQIDILQNDRSGTASDPPTCQVGGEYGGTSYEGTAHWRLTIQSQEHHGDFRDMDHTGGTFYRYVCVDPDATCEGDNAVDNAPEGECYGSPISETWCGSYVCFFDAVDPESLAEYLVDQFVETLDEPDPQFSPPGGTTLVNFDTWMWVPNLPENQQEEFEPISVPGQWVDASASFEQIEWDMGDGTDPVRCDFATDAESAQANGCIHNYNRSSAGEPNDEFQGTVSVIWQVEYNGMLGGEPVGGPDAAFDVLTENGFTLAVAESQAIITD